MNKFLINILIIIISIITIISVLELAFKNNNNFVEKRFNNFYENKDSIEVVFVGNSHIQAFNISTIDAPIPKA